MTLLKRRTQHKIVADTGFWVGIANARDQHHQAAKALLAAVAKAKLNLVVNDYIIDEAITFINRRVGYQVALAIYDSILSECQLLWLEPKELESCREIFAVYKGALSFTDAAIVHTMRREGLRRLLSFDSRFDRVKGIERIYNHQQLQTG